jgi:CRP-like cAMP-binding protein
VNLDSIKSSPYEFIPRTGYSFEERLAERSKELRRAIEKYGSVIGPVTVSGEDMQLVDGYCRHTTLKAMNIPRIYAYVGRL